MVAMDYRRKHYMFMLAVSEIATEIFWRTTTSKIILV